MADNKNTKSELSESCFVIMPISNPKRYPKGHFTNIYNQIFIPAIKEAGFTPYRVDENAICDSIINKIFDAIQQCPIALCDLSSRNPNVLYELGLRQAYDNPVVLVHDEKTDRIFDVSGISTVQYNSNRLYENVVHARESIKNALQETAKKGGKNNSLVRIVKSQSANFDDVTVSSDDKLEIMLNRIISEISNLKSGFEDNINQAPSTIVDNEIWADAKADILRFKILGPLKTDKSLNRVDLNNFLDFLRDLYEEFRWRNLQKTTKRELYKLYKEAKDLTEKKLIELKLD